MAIRVAAIGTGNVGVHALRALITNPDYELTGVWVSSESKAGKDAGELAGLDVSTGITASTDLDAVLATGPQCAVYTAMADNRLPDALEDYRRILAAGVNVVGSSAVFLQYPWQVLPKELLAPIEDAAREGNSSLFVNGIDPGIRQRPASAGAGRNLPEHPADPLHGDRRLRHLRQRDRHVRRDGIRQAARRDPDAAATGRAESGVGIGGAPTRRGSGRRTRPGHRTHERVPAPEDFDIASGHIPKGSAAALRFEVHGLVDGKPAVVLEHVTRLREDLCPDWPQPAQPGGCYRIEITGEPSYAIDVCLSSPNGDHNHAGLVATAMRVVNAIPAVVAAPAGIRTTLDLPLITGRGLYSAG